MYPCVCVLICHQLHFNKSFMVRSREWTKMENNEAKLIKNKRNKSLRAYAMVHLRMHLKSRSSFRMPRLIHNNYIYTLVIIITLRYNDGQRETIKKVQWKFDSKLTHFECVFLFVLLNLKKKTNYSRLLFFYHLFVLWPYFPCPTMNSKINFHLNKFSLLLFFIFFKCINGYNNNWSVWLKLPLYYKRWLHAVLNWSWIHLIVTIKLFAFSLFLFLYFLNLQSI